MGDERKINIIIEAKQSADAALTALANRLTSITGIAVAGAAALAAYGLAVAEVTRRAIKQEEADVRLAIALASIGKNSEEARDRLSALASEIQDATGQSDEAVQEAMGTLIQLGRVGVENIERVTRATVELAAVTGRDLGSAADLMAKAAQGNTAALSRYGLVLDDDIPKSQKLAAVLDLIESNMTGTAAAAGQTLGSAFKRIGNDFDDLLQALGKSIVQNETFRVLLAEVAQALKDAATWVGNNRSAVDRWAETIALAAVAASELLIGVTKLAVGFSYAANPIAATLEWLGLMEEGTTELRKTIQMDALSALDAMTARIDALQKKLKEVGPSIVDVPSKIKNFGPAASSTTEELTGLNAILDKLGLDTMAKVTQGAIDVEVALTAIEDALASGEINSEEFDAILESLMAMTEHMPNWTEDMSAAFSVVGKGIQNAISLTDQLSVALEEQATDAALSFGDTLVDAAFGAKVSWGQFFRQLMADLAKAIVRALILRAITTLGTFGAASAAGAAGGAAGAGGASIGGGLVGAQHGGVVTGGFPGVDSVAAMLAPGEIVLPPDVARDFREIASMARGGSSTDRAGHRRDLHLTIPIAPRSGWQEREVGELIEAIVDLVERKGWRLPATSLVPS